MTKGRRNYTFYFSFREVKENFVAFTEQECSCHLIVIIIKIFHKFHSLKSTAWMIPSSHIILSSVSGIIKHRMKMNRNGKVHFFQEYHLGL